MTQQTLWPIEAGDRVAMARQTRFNYRRPRESFQREDSLIAGELCTVAEVQEIAGQQIVWLDIDRPHGNVRVAVDPDEIRPPRESDSSQPPIPNPQPPDHELHEDRSLAVRD